MELVESSQSTPRKNKFTPDMDKCLLEELHNQILIGGKVPNGFKDVAYACARVVNAKFNLQIVKHHVVN